jgi:hypothetical protein
MIETKRKEEISKSYLNAVCATKGISMTIETHDDDGIDVTLSKTIKKTDGSDYGVRMGVQLKSTSFEYKETNDFLFYPLKKKNYDDLRRSSSIKSFLFILILPEKETDWINQSIDQLVIKKCMYWFDLNNLPNSDNNTSVSVHIPKSQYVSPDVLEDILIKIAEEKLL